MSDLYEDQVDEDEVELDEDDTETSEEGESTEATETSAAKTPRTPAGEGEITPVDFAKWMDEQLGNKPGTTRPQVIYGLINSNKAFQECLVDRGEGVKPRQVVNLEKAEVWFRAKQERKAEREAKAAAAAAEDGATEEA